MCAPNLEVHAHQPFCLFGHVTPHGPIRDALDGYMLLTSPVTFQKLIVSRAPYTTNNGFVGILGVTSSGAVPDILQPKCQKDMR